MKPKPWPEVQEFIGPLAPNRRVSLETSIEQLGYRGAPVYLMPDGRIIDGHNRYDIVGDECPVEVIDVDEATGFALALAHNEARRQLTAVQIRELRKRQKETAFKLRKEGKTQPQAAAAVGVPVGTLKWWESEANNGNKVGANHTSTPYTATTYAADTLPDTRVKIPASENASIAGRIAAGETQSAVAADYGITRRRAGQIAEKEAKKRERATEKEKARAAAAALVPPEGLVIRHCSFEKQANDIADGSVSLIFTDPPYARKNLNLYAKLAEVAGRVLAPGGSLLCYCGHFLVPDLYVEMKKHLRPWWIIAAAHGGKKARMTEYGIVVHWKPILWFVKGTRGDKNTMVADMTTGDREKDHHEWQQAESEAQHWIRSLTYQGDLVWDPFCGSGTTANVAHRLGRLALTCDVDPRAVADAKARISA